MKTLKSIVTASALLAPAWLPVYAAENAADWFSYGPDYPAPTVAVNADGNSVRLVVPAGEPLQRTINRNLKVAKGEDVKEIRLKARLDAANPVSDYAFVVFKTSQYAPGICTATMQIKPGEWQDVVIPNLGRFNWDAGEITMVIWMNGALKEMILDVADVQVVNYPETMAPSTEKGLDLAVYNNAANGMGAVEQQVLNLVKPDEKIGIDSFAANRPAAKDMVTQLHAYGYFVPQVSGEYQFKVTGRNDAKLFLSHDAAARKAVPVAASYMPYNYWDSPELMPESNPVNLIANQPYYVDLVTYSYDGAADFKVEYKAPGAAGFTGVPAELLRRTTDEFNDFVPYNPNTTLEFEPLLLLGDNVMVVKFITFGPCAAAVEYRKVGDTEWTRKVPLRMGQIVEDKEVHSVTLDKLQPGAKYEYRIVTWVGAEPDPQELKITAAPENQVWQFTAATKDKDSLRILLTSDIHLNQSPNNMQEIMETVNWEGVENPDLFILAGDYGNTIDDPEEVYQFLAGQLAKHDGFRIPSVVMRGNHDTWGRQTPIWEDIFNVNGEKTYFAFRYGPAFFITLDTGWWDYPRFLNNRFEEYRAEQRAWLQEVVKRDDFKTAKFRIVIGHVPLHPWAGGGLDNIRNNAAFYDVINNAEPKVDLVIGGHTHRYFRVNPKSDEIYSVRPQNRGKDWPENDANYTLLVNSGYNYQQQNTSIVDLDITNDKLDVKVMRGEGEPFDAFRITVDGKVTDLIEAPHFNRFHEQQGSDED